MAKMLSSTESFLKIEGSCDRYPMPRRARWYMGMAVMSWPSRTMRPDIGGMSPTISKKLPSSA